MLSGLSASFIGNSLSFIRFQDISFVQFCNILQDNGVLNRFFIKSEKNLMSHMEDAVVRQAKALNGIIYCIAPQSIGYDFFP